MRVCAGVDPVTKRRHDLIEVVPPGPKAYERAEATRAGLVASVAERRNPRTSATIDQLLEKYLDRFDGAPNTLTLYRGYVKNHVSPLIGRVKVGALDADILDSIYAELRRCRKHGDGRPGVDHRVDGDHDCNERCRPHSCHPLAASTVRHMHFILSGAHCKAVRWKWVAISPVGDGEPAAAPKADPQPPTPERVEGNPSLLVGLVVDDRRPRRHLHAVGRAVRASHGGAAGGRDGGRPRRRGRAVLMAWRHRVRA